MKISRWYLAISTTACVVLFTMGALSMLESQNYIMAGVFLFFAFWVPLQDELDRLFKRRFGIGTDTETDPKTGKGVGSEEKSR